MSVRARSPHSEDLLRGFSRTAAGRRVWACPCRVAAERRYRRCCKIRTRLPLPPTTTTMAMTTITMTTPRARVPLLETIYTANTHSPRQRRPRTWTLVVVVYCLLSRCAFWVCRCRRYLGDRFTIIRYFYYWKFVVVFVVIVVIIVLT